jgi:hypothetical protein
MTGRCQVMRTSGESADCYAVRCAEDFLRRNGYTTEPAHGPLRPDPQEEGSVNDRRNLFYGSAIVHRRIGHNHYVGFRYRDSSDNVGRAVTMDENFTNLTLDHVSSVWPPDERLPLCKHPASTVP